MHDSSIERESLRGTVLGLHDWISTWVDNRDNRDGDMDPELVEGISAWMRGWKDLDDGVCLRERERLTATTK